MPVEKDYPVPVQSKADLFTDSEISAILAGSPNLWWTAFVQLGFGSALRTSELLGMHWSDFDRTTRTVRITAQALLSNECPRGISLRVRLRDHQEGFVPLDIRVFSLLDSLRRDRPNDGHLSIPNWRLDALWTQIVVGEPVNSAVLAPYLSSHFTVLQRFGRHAMTRELGAPLACVNWKRRTVASLCHIYANRTAGLVAPAVLAGYMGVPRTADVLRYYDVTMATGGVK